MTFASSSCLVYTTRQSPLMFRGEGLLQRSSLESAWARGFVTGWTSPCYLNKYRHKGIPQVFEVLAASQRLVRLPLGSCQAVFAFASVALHSTSSEKACQVSWTQEGILTWFGPLGLRI